MGRIEDDGLPLEARCGVLVREREVHLEAWAVQALAETIEPDLKIAAGPYAERDLRAELQAHADSSTRERGMAALERLETARDAVAAAAPKAVVDALGSLAATFVELTRLEPVRNHGRYYGARTLSYIDCMRDLDVTIAPSLLADIAPALEVLFEASRWYCGQINAISRALIERALPHDGPCPFIPVTTEIVKTLMAPPAEIGDEAAELERRLSAILADPDPTTIGARARAAFADHLPAWPLAVFESVDILIAASSEAAIAAGDFLVVIGDVHPGDNPLRQGLFAHRHPRPAELQRMLAADAGSSVALLLPPWAPGMGVDARCATLAPQTFIHIAAMPDSRAQGARRTWLPTELMIDAGDVVDHSGELCIPLLDILGPVSLAAARTFELHTDEEHAPRATIGRVVIRRESWSVLASEIPERAKDFAAFARDRGIPRRVFAKSPLEPKPIYLDTDSLILARILCRQARQAATDSPGARIRFTEMLPAPEDCWLTDTAGNRYVSEFRLVAVDHTRRGGTAAALANDCEKLA